MEKKEAIREFCLIEAMKILAFAISKGDTINTESIIVAAKKFEDYITK